MLKFDWTKTVFTCVSSLNNNLKILELSIGTLFCDKIRANYCPEQISLQESLISFLLDNSILNLGEGPNNLVWAQFYTS